MSNFRRLSLRIFFYLHKIKTGEFSICTQKFEYVFSVNKNSEHIESNH